SRERQRALVAAQLVDLRSEVVEETRRARAESEIVLGLLRGGCQDSSELRIDRKMDAVARPHPEQLTVCDGVRELRAVAVSRALTGRVQNKTGAEQPG